MESCKGRPLRHRAEKRNYGRYGDNGEAHGLEQKEGVFSLWGDQKHGASLAKGNG